MKHLKKFEDMGIYSPQHPKKDEIVRNIEDVLLDLIDGGRIEILSIDVVIDGINFKDNIVDLSIKYGDEVLDSVDFQTTRERLIDDVIQRMESFGYKHDCTPFKRATTAEIIFFVRPKDVVSHK